MAVALDAPPVAAAPGRPAVRASAFAVAGIASIGAGAIHAAAAGAHSGARQAVLAFAFTAAIQLLLGALALVSSNRLVGLGLASTNILFVAGWVVARRSGISFVEGLDHVEPIGWADASAAALAGVSAVLAITALFAAVPRRVLRSGILTRAAVLPVAVMTLTAMVALDGHEHADGATHSHTDAATAAVVPPKSFVPGEPIDLGGVPGVTPEQQAQAENLLAATLYYLPHWADYRTAEAEGWRSIHDGVTGYEHFINASKYDDGKILDPTAPESLVYRYENGQRKLVAAMFMLKPGTTLADVPQVGGKLMQWHIHDNLCFTPEGAVGGLRQPGGPCRDGLVPGGEQPMIHVWIESNPCGPFAALDGIAGGTVASGEAKLCDHVHGKTST